MLWLTLDVLLNNNDSDEISGYNATLLVEHNLNTELLPKVLSNLKDKKYLYLLYVFEVTESQFCRGFMTSVIVQSSTIAKNVCSRVFTKACGEASSAGFQRRFYGVMVIREPGTDHVISGTDHLIPHFCCSFFFLSVFIQVCRNVCKRKEVKKKSELKKYCIRSGLDSFDSFLAGSEVCL